VTDKPSLTIPPPEKGREPMKTNVFRFAQINVSTLSPMFPYVDEGAIVPCVATFRGGPGKRFGRFQHFNTVDEVVIMFGAKGGRGRAGMVRVGPKLHQVGAPFEDPEDTGSLRVTTITQRQAIGQPQREEYRFACEKCDRRLYMEEVDATPPRRGTGPGAVGGSVPFATTIETYAAAKHFNENAEARRCKHCGHQNPPFPIEDWGWDQYVRQAEIIEMAQDSIDDALAAAGVPKTDR
jgi:hypothetical protein